jgi:hypothetical protein
MTRIDTREINLSKEEATLQNKIRKKEICEKLKVINNLEP